MFLAFKLRDLITVPFGWLMGWLYQVTGNYGVSMILFAVCVQMVLLPITAKSKKSMMKMSRIQPQMQEIQRRYADDQQKQGEMLRQLQQDEGVAALDLLHLGLETGHLHHALLALCGDGQQSHLDADGEEDHGDAVVIGDLVQPAHQPAEGDRDQIPKLKC